MSVPPRLCWQRVVQVVVAHSGAAATILLTLLVWLLVLAWYMQPAALYLKSDGLARRAQGVYRAEVLDGRTAVFSGWEPRLELPARSSAPSLLTLDMAPPAGVAARPLKVWSGDTTPASFVVQPGWRTYRLLLPGEYRISSRQQWLNLSTVASAHEGDNREVGVALGTLHLVPRGILHTPHWQDGLHLLVAVVLLALLLRHLGLAWLPALPAGGAVLAGIRPLLNTTPQSLPFLLVGLAGAVLLVATTRTLQRRSALWLRYWLMLLAAGITAALAHPAPCAMLLLTLQIVGLLVALLTLLLYAGFGITWFLRSQRLAPVLPLYTPLVGFAALSAAGHALGYLTIGTNQTALPLLALFTIINGVAWRQGARPVLRCTHLWAVLPGAVALLLALFPLYQVGYLTALGHTIDTLSYVVRAEYLQTRGLMLYPPLDYGEPVIGWLQFSVRVGLREGDTFLLALLSTLLNLRPHLLFPILMAVWYALIPVGLFVLAHHELRMQRRTALLASLFVAVQPLLHFITQDTFLSQAGGMALWFFALAAALGAVRHGGTRAMVLAGLLLAALASVYYAYLIYLVPVVMLVALYLWVVQSRRRHCLQAAAPPHTRLLRAVWSSFVPLFLRGVGIGIAALLTMPVVWVLVYIQFLYFRDVMNWARDGKFTLADTGNITAYPHIAEVIGLINHVGGAPGAGWALLPQPPPLLFNGAFALALALALYALVRCTGRQRITMLAALAVLGLGLLQQRFWIDDGRGYPYGYFKILTIVCPLLVLLVVAGALRLAHDVRGWRQEDRQPLRVALVVLLAGIFCTAGFHLITTATFFSVHRLAASRGSLEVEQAAALVPADEPLLIADFGNGLWTIYLLDHPPMYYREPSSNYKVATQPHSPQMIHYAVVAKTPNALIMPPQPAEPWFAPGNRTVLWEGKDYMLVRRTDTEVVADMPLMTGGVSVPLTSTIEITVGGGAMQVMGIVHATEEAEEPVLQQALQGAPQQLEVTLYSPFGGVLRLEDGEGEHTLFMVPGVHTHQVAVYDTLSVTLQQSAPAVMPMLPTCSGYLAGVRVVGDSDTTQLPGSAHGEIGTSPGE